MSDQNAEKLIVAIQNLEKTTSYFLDKISEKLDYLNSLNGTFGQIVVAINESGD